MLFAFYYSDLEGYKNIEVKVYMDWILVENSKRQDLKEETAGFELFVLSAMATGVRWCCVFPYICSPL